MQRLFRTQINALANEDSDADTTYHKRSYARVKSSSHVVPSPVINVPEKTNNLHIVRMRLVFIRIGKNVRADLLGQ